MTPKKKPLKIKRHNYSERATGFNFDNGNVAFSNVLEKKGRNAQAKASKAKKRKLTQKGFEKCVAIALVKAMAQSPAVLDMLQSGSPSNHQSV